VIAGCLKAFVRVYQLTLSPIFGGACRFTPSCSQYAIEAIEIHGALHGSRLALRRIFRCHPFGRSGHDPVPGSDAGGPGHAG
jgi:hypothetical protein